MCVTRLPHLYEAAVSISFAGRKCSNAVGTVASRLVRTEGHLLSGATLRCRTDQSHHCFAQRETTRNLSFATPSALAPEAPA